MTLRICLPYLLATALAGFTSSAMGDSGAPRCNPDPITNQVVMEPLDGNVQALADALINDSAFRERMGGIAFLRISDPWVVAAFPELDDPEALLEHLRASERFRFLSLNARACGQIPPLDKLGNAAEYYNPSLDHYFITADAGEKAVLESGTIPGWSKTGEQFTVVLEPSCHLTTDMHLVYRFYRKPIGGPDTHFFTASETECGKVRDDPFRQWQFEGVPFWVTPPTPQGCSATTVPVFRIYNNGSGGAPNHRYTTRREVVDAMVHEGWIEEGVTMCADGRSAP